MFRKQAKDKTNKKLLPPLVGLFLNLVALKKCDKTHTNCLKNVKNTNNQIKHTKKSKKQKLGTSCLIWVLVTFHTLIIKEQKTKYILHCIVHFNSSQSTGAHPDQSLLVPICHFHCNITLYQTLSIWSGNP